MPKNERPEHLQFEQRQPSGTPRATIIVLHGWGSTAKLMMDSILPFTPEEFRVITLQAPLRTPDGGFMWYEMTAEGPASGTLVTMLERLDATLNPEAGIVPRDAPIFLVGFSQGGTASLSFATLRFSWVRGVASLSGSLLGDRTLPGPVGVLRGKPILIVHGRADKVRPLGMGRDAARRLKAAGAIVEFIEHDHGHEVPPQVWSKVVAWVRGVLAR